ncbi:alpha/beta-hydrolase [Zopfia rhizophila CBS 207.26]|uniref:Alpha/beta-hydrolase n=1 Tax=Zopfia rhizophila CBS 207.26 TaxID=1314779 RepID=A0A6A6E279_9PEZI|nr:alpha/beta-hydrolase [Zopfia rhizophila CBS 207.26]
MNLCPVILFLPSLGCSRSLASIRNELHRNHNSLSATIVGSSNSALGITPSKIESFKRIPFAQLPVGPLLLKAQEPLNAPFNTIQATNSLPPGCPQFIFPDISIPGLPSGIANLILDSPLFKNGTIQGQEDCLTLNIRRPAAPRGITNYLCSFGSLVEAMNWGVRFSVNYRLGGFGFLPGKEILQDGSASLGLLDQRLWLEWVADNIAEFVYLPLGM